MVQIKFWQNSDPFKKKEHLYSSKTAEVRALIDNSLKFSIENFSFFLNRSEFRQNLIGTIIRVLVRNLRAQSEIGNHERDQRVSVQSEPSVRLPPPNQRIGLMN